MDYFSVIVLIIVVFIFIKDRKVKKIELIQKEDENIFFKIESIKKKIKIINVKEDQMMYDKIKKSLASLKEEYVLIKNNNLDLSIDNINTIIANYINYKNRLCGFNLIYNYVGKKITLKKIYVDIINYLNIFNKQDLKTYGVIIAKKTDFENEEITFTNSMLSCVWTDFTTIGINEKQVAIGKLKKIYIQKINNSKISIILKLILLIISGSFITSNLIYAVINIKNNLLSLILTFVIYYCYSYIIRYVYSPIGKHKIFNSYILPIYFIAYLFVSIYMFVSKVIKKVQAS